MFIIAYISLYLNPFTFYQNTNHDNVIELVTNEFFGTSMFNIIYFCQLWRSTTAHAPFFAISVFLFFGMILFTTVSVTEWSTTEAVEMNIHKLYLYQALHLVLLCFILMVMIYSIWKFEKYTLTSFLFHFSLTFLSYVVFVSLPKVLYVYFYSIGYPSDTIFFLKTTIFIAPMYNLLFLFLINWQHPRERREIRIFLDKLVHPMKTGPVPHISVEEPSHQRTHIALNLMRNPLNSFSKLERQYEENIMNSNGISNSSNLFLSVPKEHYDQRQLELNRENNKNLGKMLSKEKAKSLNCSPRPKQFEGLRTVALLRRASFIGGVGFYKISESSSSESSESTSSTEKKPEKKRMNLNEKVADIDEVDGTTKKVNSAESYPEVQVLPVVILPTSQTNEEISTPPPKPIKLDARNLENQMNFFLPRQPREPKMTKTADRIFSVLERTRRSVSITTEDDGNI